MFYFEKISSLNNQIEAQLLSSILDEREIPFEIKSYHDAAYDGLFQITLGYGSVFAPKSYSKEILEILEDIRKGYQEGDNDE